MTQTIPLPPRFDVEAASALWKSILLSESDLQLDAAELQHLSAAGLQTLLMAQQHQKNRGRSLNFINAGPDMAACLRTLGATQYFPLHATGQVGGPA